MSAKLVLKAPCPPNLTTVCCSLCSRPRHGDQSGPTMISHNIKDKGWCWLKTDTCIFGSPGRPGWCTECGVLHQYGNIFIVSSSPLSTHSGLPTFKIAGEKLNSKQEI